jgi:hypothetical protein
VFFGGFAFAERMFPVFREPAVEMREQHGS